MRTQAEQILSHERQTRTEPRPTAEAVRKDAAHWVEVKQHLPDEVQDMERDYQAIHAVDLGTVAAAVQKARDRLAGKEGRSRQPPRRRSRDGRARR